MKLVVITNRYDSTVIKTKVYPTKLDANGNPMYVIGLSDERAQVLIDGGVAEEYVTESNETDNTVISNNSNVVDPTSVDTNSNELSNNVDGDLEEPETNESDDSDNNDDAVDDNDSNKDVSSDTVSTETTKKTKSNSKSKKNNESK